MLNDASTHHSRSEHLTNAINLYRKAADEAYTIWNWGLSTNNPSIAERLNFDVNQQWERLNEAMMAYTAKTPRLFVGVHIDRIFDLVGHAKVEEIMAKNHEQLFYHEGMVMLMVDTRNSHGLMEIEDHWVKNAKTDLLNLLSEVFDTKVKMNDVKTFIVPMWDAKVYRSRFKRL